MKSKKELDKDIMFSKIMPSVPQPAPAAEEEDICDEEPQNVFAGLREELFPGKEPSLVPTNILEIPVMEYIDEVIEKFNSCRCDRCRCDVAALALNHLSPKYVVAEDCVLQEMRKKIPKKEIYDALIRAVLTVRAHPRH